MRIFGTSGHLPTVVDWWKRDQHPGQSPKSLEKTAF